MSTEEFRVYHASAIGAAVRHFRQEAGLTQAELAQMIGVHRSYLSDLERGKVTEQVERIVALLRAVGARITVRQAEW